MVEHSGRNKMTGANLAIVFAPTLMRPRQNDPRRELDDNPHQQTVRCLHLCVLTNIMQCARQVIKTLLEADEELWQEAERIVCQACALLPRCNN